MNRICKLLLSAVLGLGLFSEVGTPPAQAGTGKGVATASAHTTYYYVYYRANARSPWRYLGCTTNATVAQQADEYLQQVGYQIYIYTYRS